MDEHDDHCRGACECLLDAEEYDRERLKGRASTRRPEQGTGGRHRRFWKRFTSKIRRRLGRALLDDAPRHNHFRGWWD